LNYLKKFQTILNETHQVYQNSLTNYIFESVLCDQLRVESRIATNSALESKLKQKNINISKFKRTYQDIIKV
jgi:hypothetical protein